jgi:hypothetical protein
VPETLSTDEAVQSALVQLVQNRGLGSLRLRDPLGDPGEISLARTAYMQTLRKWETSGLHRAASQQHTKDRSESLEKAREETAKETRYFDYGSTWGQGPEFILQFTAVVTIIFAVVVLGILHRLGEDQAGTILAAIAGYVLGQAVRSGRGPPVQSQATQSQGTRAPSAADGGAARGEVPAVSNSREIPPTK